MIQPGLGGRPRADAGRERRTVIGEDSSQGHQGDGKQRNEDCDQQHGRQGKTALVLPIYRGVSFHAGPIDFSFACMGLSYRYHGMVLVGFVHVSRARALVMSKAADT
jgi:hypothetical protein